MEYNMPSSPVGLPTNLLQFFGTNINIHYMPSNEALRAIVGHEIITLVSISQDSVSTYINSIDNIDTNDSAKPR